MCCPCLCVTCGCCRLSATFVCRPSATFVYRHLSPTLICVKMIQTTKIYSICDKKLTQWLSIYCIIGIIGILVIIVTSNV